MSRIVITMDIDPDLADDGDATGVTETAFEHLHGALMQFGTDIDIQQYVPDGRLE